MTREYSIAGIPTVYRCTRFRSRHEATWAAFFDELGWKWDYEPCDLAGYIPDFDLKFSARPLLIEIKPTPEDIDLAKSKIECSGWEGDAAILITGDTAHVGEIFEAGGGWDRCVLTYCLACQKPTLVSEGGRWACRNCRAGTNRDLWWAYRAFEQWAKAKNQAQWRPAAE